MSYAVIFIASRWGSELGGINVFNTGLARGMAKILPADSPCICYVEKPPEALANLDGVQVRLHTGDANSLAREIEAMLFTEAQSPQGVLIVGHDVKTGAIAIDCVTYLKQKHRNIDVLSAVVSHMDYTEYGRKKGYTLEQVEERSKVQHSTVKEADLAFAVGPLLESSFQIARKQGSSERGRVQMLIPGAANIKPRQENESSALRFFVAGRLNREDDTIKNGFLSIQALLEAYRSQRDVGEGRWSTRGHLLACGIDPVQDADLLAPLRERANESSAFEIEAQAFSGDQERMYELLASSHVALMPSWHEGFGLTGWEALCAGVPLVCSRQSGLAQLLDELRRQQPDVPFDSIEFVNLGGSGLPGSPSSHDINIVRTALIRVVNDYSRRKSGALLLAKRLKEEYTWERCAHELVSQTSWNFPSSVDWRIRQKVASRAATTGDGNDDPGVVALALESCADGTTTQDWSVICSAFNYFSNRGKSAGIAERKHLLQQLEIIGGALTAERSAANSGAELLAIRDTGNIDLYWRYMAACSSVAPSFREFESLFSPVLKAAIFSDSFLQREMLFYACRFADEFSHKSKALAREFLSPLRDHLDSSKCLQIRLARLEIPYPALREVMDSSDLHESYKAESLRCLKVQEQPHDVTLILGRFPELAPTLLALSGLKPNTARQLVDQAISFIGDYNNGPLKLLAWRGDRRLFAGILSAGLPTHEILNFLRFMAEDEDEGVRWAAVDLAFSLTLRARLLASIADNGATESTLMSQLGAIVDSAIAFDSGHPWLNREFLRLYSREHEVAEVDNGMRRFSIHDFPYSRQLFGPLIGHPKVQLVGALHPEVRAARIEAQRTIKRVLLVLPSIELSTNIQRGASLTSTPPLGLGLISAHLTLSGHDVQLADCHRYPQFSQEVSEHANTFDLIGLNVVLSTVKSAHKIFKQLREQTMKPILVAGGPAANLDVWRFSTVDEDERRAWDFAISGFALENMSLLLMSLDAQNPWPVSDSLHANEESLIIALRDVQSTSRATGRSKAAKSRSTLWMQLDVDRRIYQGPLGNYEPTHTRAAYGTMHEAHIVMSQGCDWNCTFCTERKELSGGELRRSVDSVMNEIENLSRGYENLRVQFIDDNLLPQIASKSKSDRVSQATAVAWADSFLQRLCVLKEVPVRTFGWRGIFRLEDFFRYEEHGPPGSFVATLARSGCRMLAFGVEHGDPVRRSRLKAGEESSNDDIIALFARLREAGIQTKAYFMLGGRTETRESLEKTIVFALECGVTLAYFALYKEFVKATMELSRESLPQLEQSERYLTYSQLWPKWDDLIGAEFANVDGGGSDHIVDGLYAPLRDSAVSSYHQLAEMGFRFKDLVKYNDYHSETGPSANLLSKVSWGDPGEYFGAVEDAYLRFYLRPKFVEDYKILAENGY